MKNQPALPHYYLDKLSQFTNLKGQEGEQFPLPTTIPRFGRLGARLSRKSKNHPGKVPIHGRSNQGVKCLECLVPGIEHG